MVLLIYVNQVVFFSVVLGFLASSVFFFINILFVGHALFQNESAFVRFVLGGLFELILLGLVGWVVLIVYNLDALRLSVALGLLAGFSSLLNRLLQGRGRAGRGR
jgi:hypothetical protein